MNELSIKILDTMESSHLGKMSKFILFKQSDDLGLDLDHLSQKDVPSLADKLKVILPFFLGEETNNLVVNIRKLGNNGIAVM